MYNGNFSFTNGIFHEDKNYILQLFKLFIILTKKYLLKKIPIIQMNLKIVVLVITWVEDKESTRLSHKIFSICVFLR